MRRRGYGMAGDVLFGIGGSLAGGALYNVFASAPGREWVPTIATAFAGAVVLIVAQRLFWPAPGVRPGTRPAA
jgi:uncharacterized membrane protein YeaQ/YmgE (transglycosylase-associated protein family)